MAIATSASAPERILERIDWQVVRRLDGMLQGDYRSLLGGHGLDLSGLREYQVSDDVRHIDWNVTARLDEAHVRQYTEDRELTAWLLLDRSPSMGFGPLDRTKERVLADLSATIAQLLVRNGNKVGAVLYNNAIERTMPPRQGRDQVLLLIRDVLSPVRSLGTVTNLAPLLDTAAAMIRRRSLVILISDFISEPGWEQPLRRLTERHEVVAIRLFDRREFELPDAGLIVVQDAETGEQLVIDSSDAELRGRLRAAAGQREQELQWATRRAGVDLHTVSTDDDLVAALVRLIESRRRRRA
jgi:uncharacterized protein (DUF58 family)